VFFFTAVNVSSTPAMKELLHLENDQKKKNMRQPLHLFKHTDNQLTACFVFADFEAAFRFMQEAAAVISLHNHHPKWTNSYHTVEIALCTHDAGDLVTEKDLALATALEALSAKHGAKLL
jgi:4a-hydroxytetrahydrobiopterin dehydratase